MEKKAELTPWLDMAWRDRPGEQWRDVASAPGYQVSSEGRVRHLPRRRVLRTGGHAPEVAVSFVVDGIRQGRVLKLVLAKVFNLPGPAGTYWTQANGIREDNRVANLEAVTRAELSARQQQRPADEPRRRGRPAKPKTKLCGYCGHDYPLEAFAVKRQREAGHQTGSMCRDCRTKRDKRIKRPGLIHEGRRLAALGQRRCSSCGVAQPLDLTHFRPSAAPLNRGFSYVCLTCKPLPVPSPGPDTCA